MADPLMTDGTPCAICGTPTSQYCSGCSDASEVVPDATKTAYCRAKCQKEDENNHKAECKKLENTRRLYQAGALLRQLWLVLRTATYRWDLEKVAQKEGNIKVFGKVNATEQGFPPPFNHELFEEEKVKETVLSYLACTAAMTSMSSLADTLMSDTCDRFEEVELHVKHAQIRVQMWSCKDKQCPLKVVDGNDTVAHDMFRVKLKDSSEWYAIDLTNAQYGRLDTVIPWSRYTSECVKSIIYCKPWKPSGNRAMWATNFARTATELGYKNDIWGCNTKCLEDLFDHWLSDTGTKVIDLITLEASSFAGKMQKITEYTTEGLAKRRHLPMRCGASPVESQGACDETKEPYC